MDVCYFQKKSVLSKESQIWHGVKEIVKNTEKGYQGEEKGLKNEYHQVLKQVMEEIRKICTAV
jgi:hypothetical protein